ncbi:hypothetical protein ACJ41O_009363 [Fusarium nematophilum]
MASSAKSSPTRVKRERSPSPETSEETPRQKRQAFETPDIDAESRDFAWANCEGVKDVQSLATKEKANQTGEEFCTKLADELSSALENSEDDSDDASDIADRAIITQWLQDHRTTQEKHRDYKVLVGVEGPTGAGKSSFLGALLGIQELLPSGQEAAATAVVAEVSWNDDDRDDYQYCAEIKFRGLDDVKRDVELLLREYKTLLDIKDREFENHSDKKEATAQCESVIKHEVQKVTAVWGVKEPALRRSSKKRKTDEAIQAGVEWIFGMNSAVLELLNGGIKKIHTSDKEEFARQVRPFLDSTRATHGGTVPFSAWPLTEKVNIFVKSDILKSGIHLVDLPGCGDAVDSRSEIAQNFRQNLDVRIVVTPIHRAADEKQGHDLMHNGFEQLRLKMNGKLNAESFGVVLSKMDDFNVDTYIDGCPELRDDPEVAKKKNRIKQLERRKKKLPAELNELQDKKYKAESSVQRARNTLKSARSKATAKDDTSDETLKKLRILEQAEIRARAAQDDAKRAVDGHEGKEKAIMLEIKHLNDWLCHKACQVRNKRVTERIHEDFLTRQDELRDTENDDEDDMGDECWLPVLPISTSAFWELENEKAPIPGFPNKASTGIPAVAQWLHRATLESRMKHLDATLAERQNLMATMKSYSRKQTQGKELRFTKDDVLMALSSTHEVFTTVIRTTLSELAEKVQELDPLAKRKSAMTRFNREALEVVEMWAYKYPNDDTKCDKMHWLTYQANIAREGKRFTSRGTTVITYHWLESLATPLLKSIADLWDTKLNKELPGMRKEAVEVLVEIWRKYLEALVKAIKECVPSLSAEFDTLLPALRDRLRTISSDIGSVLDKLSHKSHTAALDVVEVLRAQMQPTFANALDLRSTGMHAARQETIKKRIKKDVKPICIEVLKTLSDGLEKNKETIPQELDRIATNAIDGVKGQVSVLLNNLLENDEDGSTAQGRKGMLHRRIRGFILKWDNEWQLPGKMEDHILGRDHGIPTSLDDIVIKREDSEAQMYDWHGDIAE